MTTTSPSKLFLSKYNGYQHISAIVDGYTKFMETEMRNFAYDSNWSGSYTEREGDNFQEWKSYELGQVYSMRLSLNFYGYDKTGNTRRWPEKSTDIFCNWLFLKHRAIYSRFSLEFRDVNLFGGEVDGWNFQSSHDSCWPDGVTEGLMDLVRTECDKLIPDNYFSDKRSQPDPIHPFLWHNWPTHTKMQAVHTKSEYIDEKRSERVRQVREVWPIELTGLSHSGNTPDDKVMRVDWKPRKI